MNTKGGYIIFRIYYDIRMITLISEEWKDISSGIRSIVVSKLCKRN